MITRKVRSSMPDSRLIADDPVLGEDPLGPVATMSAVTFGEREVALAGMSPDSMFTWHITCSSITFRTEGAQGDQTER